MNVGEIQTFSPQQSTIHPSSSVFKCVHCQSGEQKQYPSQARVICNQNVRGEKGSIHRDGKKPISKATHPLQSTVQFQVSFLALIRHSNHVTNYPWGKLRRVHRDSLLFLQLLVTLKLLQNKTLKKCFKAANQRSFFKRLMD